MRHGKKINHLSRTTSHRKAMLSNMASSLIKNKRINTTVAKAKALRKYVEPLITKSKDNTTQSRRVVFSYLQDKESVTELFSVVADKIAARPGGYTRIIKTGARLGDNAEMCMMELVDFNDLLIKEEQPKKSRRSRRSKSKGTSDDTAAVETVEVVEEVADAKEEEAVSAEAVTDEVAEAEEDSKSDDTASEEGAEEEKKD